MAPTRPSAIGKSATDSAQAGFTLTELLVVLAIIGLLIMAAPALMQSALPGTQSLAAARTLANDLRLARGFAVSRGETIRVEFDAAHQTYRSGNGAAHPLPNHVPFAFASPAAPHDIVFRPDGGSNGVTVFVGNKPTQHRVTADWLTGRIAIDE